MQRLARVLFHVDAREADEPALPAGVDLHSAATRQRPLVLRNLVALGQVGIEVVLPREHRPFLHLAAEGEGGGDGIIDGPAVQHRERAGQPDAHRADVGVGPGAERGGTAAENLGLGEQLGVNLEADDGFESGHDECGDVTLPHSTFCASAFCLCLYTLGPASLTEAGTSFSNALKFSMNIRASFAAC